MLFSPPPSSESRSARRTLGALSLALSAWLLVPMSAQAQQVSGTWAAVDGESTLYLTSVGDGDYLGAWVLADGRASEVEALADAGFVEGLVDGETGTALFEGQVDGDGLRIELVDIDPATFAPRAGTERTFSFRRAGPPPAEHEIDQIVEAAWERMGIDATPLLDTNVGAQPMAPAAPPGAAHPPAAPPAAQTPGAAPPAAEGRHRPEYLIRTWRSSSTSGSATPGGGGAWATDQEEVTLTPDGRITYAMGTTVSAGVPGVSGMAGANPNALTGQWWVEGGVIVVQWDHGEVTRYEYNVFIHSDGLPALRVNEPGGQPMYFR